MAVSLRSAASIGAGSFIVTNGNREPFMGARQQGIRRLVIADEKALNRLV